MKIYLDVIFFINFTFDFLLLLTVNLIFKRKVKWYRIILASLIGTLSTFLVFFKMTSFTLFLLKLTISIIMTLIAFGYKYFLKNIIYLYFLSILLGGFLYFINIQFSYKTEGLLFFHNGFSINIILLIILSPIIFYWYYRQSRYFKETLSNIYKIDIYFDGKTSTYQAYLDTGNKLYDPYKHREVILLHDESLYKELEKFIIIPFETLSSTGFLKGIVVSKIVIDDIYTFDKVLIGVSKNPFHLDEAEVILHSNFKNNLM